MYYTIVICPGSSIFSELAHDTDHVIGGGCRQCHHFQGPPKGLHDFYIKDFFVKSFAFILTLKGWGYFTNEKDGGGGISAPRFAGMGRG